jgi:predicted nucleic acid-binding protein
MLAQFGASEREIEQARLLAQRAEFDRQAAEEYRNLMLQLQTRGGILNSTPMLVNSTGKSSGFGIDVGKMISGGGA